MDGLLKLTLEAHNPAENHHRWYEVRVGQDLFGQWTVCLTYGRSGQAGQRKVYAGPEPAELKARVRDHLLRRLSAPQRIGCPYHVTRNDAAVGFDVAAWLPADVMERFSTPEGRCG